MNWLELVISTSHQGIEILTGMLMTLNITEFAMNDPEVFDTVLQNQEITWDYLDETIENISDTETTVTVYLTDDEEGRYKYEQIKNALKQLKQQDTQKMLGNLTMHFNTIKEEDWANNWKRYFKPFEVGTQFVIKPSWESYTENTDRKILEIDPNSSFGTGQHYTTKLCIEEMEEVVKKGDNVLDMGCGSGILSIAAYLLGARHITAVDNDENAVRIAIQNFDQNDISNEIFTTYTGNIIADEPLANTIGYAQYDIVIANIVADVIILMAPKLKQFLKPSGKLIASGIISDRYEEVKEALENTGLHIIKKCEKNDWIAICLCTN